MILNKKLIYSYSKSIFEIALKQNNISRWKKFLKILLYISIQKNIKIFYSNFFNSNKLYKIFKFFLNDFKMTNYEKNFLKIICENNRINLLFEILKKYKIIENKSKNIINIVLKSSNELTIYQKNIIISILKKNILKTINIKFVIDPNLISGFLILINKNVIDYSIKNYLKYLKNFLQT
ncbi:ATP synthase F1 subunit delta [Buchnera aphidicola]|uniref:ATP synthase F1 subunit delta n=1 Tax=Buchnera aphidicola TaxID=9 RepID=UPI0031B875BB